MTIDSTEYTTPQNLITAGHATVPEPQEDNSKKIIIIVVVALLFILVVTGLAIYFLAQPTTPTARIRDIFIIFMALESLLIGMTLVLLLVQLARLTNLLQNEIKPILDSLNETVSTLRGTTNFLSDNMVEPVIKANSYMAGLGEFVKLIGLVRKKPPKA